MQPIVRKGWRYKIRWWNNSSLAPLTPFYTQHHDVINEWNGYWRFDRSEKETGLDDLAEDMSLMDLHAPLYVVVGDKMSDIVRPGEKITVPLWA
ncbi:MAG: hypothetical protein ACR2KU_08965 [Gammaproteobacteria bacterium]